MLARLQKEKKDRLLLQEEQKRNELLQQQMDADEAAGIVSGQSISKDASRIAFHNDGWETWEHEIYH